MVDYVLLLKCIVLSMATVSLSALIQPLGGALVCCARLLTFLQPLGSPWCAAATGSGSDT